MQDATTTRNTRNREHAEALQAIEDEITGLDADGSAEQHDQEIAAAQARVQEAREARDRKRAANREIVQRITDEIATLEAQLLKSRIDIDSSVAELNAREQQIRRELEDARNALIVLAERKEVLEESARTETADIVHDASRLIESLEGDAGIQGVSFSGGGSADRRVDRATSQVTTAQTTSFPQSRGADRSHTFRTHGAGTGVGAASPTLDPTVVAESDRVPSGTAAGGSVGGFARGVDSSVRVGGAGGGGVAGAGGGLGAHDVEFIEPLRRAICTAYDQSKSFGRVLEQVLLSNTGDDTELLISQVANSIVSGAILEFPDVNIIKELSKICTPFRGSGVDLEYKQYIGDCLKEVAAKLQEHTKSKEGLDDNTSEKILQIADLMDRRGKMLNPRLRAPGQAVDLDFSCEISGIKRENVAEFLESALKKFRELQSRDVYKASEQINIGVIRSVTVSSVDEMVDPNKLLAAVCFADYKDGDDISRKKATVSAFIGKITSALDIVRRPSSAPHPVTVRSTGAVSAVPSA